MSETKATKLFHPTILFHATRAFNSLLTYLLSLGVLSNICTFAFTQSWVVCIDIHFTIYLQLNGKPISHLDSNHHIVLFCCIGGNSCRVLKLCRHHIPRLYVITFEIDYIVFNGQKKICVDRVRNQIVFGLTIQFHFYFR